MEELNKLFFELQEIPNLKKRLIKIQEEEKELLQQIKDLKRDKCSYEELLKEINLDNKIIELEDLNSQINDLKIETLEIQTVDDFMVLCDSYLNQNIFLEKIKVFFNYKLKVNNNLEFYIFREIEDCLEGKINSNSLKEVLLLKVKDFLKYFNFKKLYFCELENEIGIIVGSKVESGLLKEIEEKYPIFFKIIACALKEVLVNRIVNCNFDYKILKDFNNYFENTKLFIKNIDELILDILVKEILRKCKNIPTLENVNEKSKLITKINNIYKMVLENSSKRQNKALEISRKAIIKYFELSNEINTLYIYFLDSLFLQSNLSNSDLLLEQIYEIKEKIFVKIIEKESLKEFKGNLNEVKIYVKQGIGEFEERLELFLTEKEKLFKICFFEKSFTNFFKHITDFTNLNIEESHLEGLKCEYIISQCFISPTEISNYKKALLLKDILKNNCIFKENEIKEVFEINYLYKLMQTIPWCADLEDILENM